MIAWRLALQQFAPLDGSPIEMPAPTEEELKLKREATEESKMTSPIASSFMQHSVASGSVSNTPPVWRRLINAVKPGKTASEREVARWVFDNAAIEPQAIDETSVPSVGAIQLLRWTQQSWMNYSSFLSSIWARTLPTQAQMKAEGKYSDDGRKSLKLLDEFEISLNGSEQQQ